jgi:hypothetical protein
VADVSRWLGGARAEGGLLIPGVPPRRTCDLLLTTDDVRVRADDVEAPLAYAGVVDRPDPGSPDAISPNQLTGNSWRPAPWTQQQRPGGAALLVSGAYARATEPVRHRRRSVRASVERLFESGTAVPLYDQQYVGWGMAGDVDTIRVLCSLLRDRPAWRVRLDEPARVERLVGDLAARQHTAITRRTGLRRSTVVTLNAMRALGYEHRLDGRPLPGESVPTTDELVPRVLDRVRSDPYAAGAHVEADDVRGVLEHFYTGVDPWPFAALAAD